MPSAKLEVIQCCCIEEEPDGGEGPNPGEWCVQALPCIKQTCGDPPVPYCPSVAWNESYFAASGVTMPLPPGTCVRFTIPGYPCCQYVFTNLTPPTQECEPDLWDVGGSKATTYAAIPGVGCCVSDTTVLTETLTCIHSQFVPSYDGEEECVIYIADEYDNVDQWGTKPGKEITLTADFVYCYAAGGAAPGSNCEVSCPPVVHNERAVIHTQQVGNCVPVDAFATCPGQRTLVSVGGLTCAECFPCGECCNPSGNPCDGVDPEDDTFCDDPEQHYAITTCYEVLQTDDYYEQPVMVVRFPYCATPIDGGAEDRQQLAETWILGNSGTGEVQFGGWPGFNHYIDTAFLTFAGITFYMLSGSLSKLIEKMRPALAFGTTITQLGTDCWWFGTRQTCDTCSPAFPQRGSWNVGDRFKPITAADIVADDQGISVTIYGRSRKYHVCASMSLNATYASAENPVVVSQTSLTALSPVQFCDGENYEFQIVEQDVSMLDICIKGDDFFDVVGCDAIVGYPLAGFGQRCPSFPVTQKQCRSYPYNYDTCPCDTICLGVCDGIYQAIGYFCETNATIITMVRP